MKIKKLKTCDCVIFGYTQGTQSRGKTFGALILGLYDKVGNPVYVGKVGTGFTGEMLGFLMDKFDRLKTDVVPFKPEAGDKVTWIVPRLVCEVAFQVVTRDLRLRMPRFKGLRDDIEKGDEEALQDRLGQAFDARERWLDERGAAEWVKDGGDALELPELGEHPAGRASGPLHHGRPSGVVLDQRGFGDPFRGHHHLPGGGNWRFYPFLPMAEERHGPD